MYRRAVSRCERGDAKFSRISGRPQNSEIRGPNSHKDDEKKQGIRSRWCGDRDIDALEEYGVEKLTDVINRIYEEGQFPEAGFSPVYNTLGASTKCNVDKGNYHHV